VSEHVISKNQPVTPTARRRDASADSDPLESPGSHSLRCHTTDANIPNESTPAEGDGDLSPLPDRSPSTLERPVFHRGMTVPFRSCHPHILSSPAVGISELFCRSPFPIDSESPYYDAVHSEPATVVRPGPASRRAPVYSVFGSFYAEFRRGHRGTASTDQRIEFDPESSLVLSPDLDDTSNSSSHRAQSDTGSSVSRFSRSPQESACSKRTAAPSHLMDPSPLRAPRLSPLSAHPPRASHLDPVTRTLHISRCQTST